MISEVGETVLIPKADKCCFLHFPFLFIVLWVKNFMELLFLYTTITMFYRFSHFALFVPQIFGRMRMKNIKIGSGKAKTKQIKN